MKTYLPILILYIVLQNQSIFSQTSGNQLDYYKTNLNELKEGNGNNIYNSNEIDSILIMTGDSININFGGSVSTAGDVNGDGYSDLIIGAEGYSNGRGRAYIFYGGLTMDNIADLTMTGEANSANFGNSISSAGDVNGDGYDDVIVGASRYSGDRGRAYIYYGGVSMNNLADVVMIGELSGGSLGSSVSTAGDVNGDEYSDVIVGASGYNRAYIYLGGSEMNNIADVIMTGEVGGDFFGGSVSNAGDVNGDGYSDVIVGAGQFDLNGVNTIGRAYLFFGSSSMDNVADIIMTGELINSEFGNSVSTAGDINGDGYSDVIVSAYSYVSHTGRVYLFYGGALMDNMPDVTITGGANSTNFGCSVSIAGDVNGDGYSDVIIGAHRYNTNTGRSYIFYGGLTMDSTSDVIMTGEATDNLFGWSVSSAGDVNGDGYSDVIVGAGAYNNYTGRAYLYKTIPFIRIKLKISIEGMYSPLYNQLARQDTVCFYLRSLSPPFGLIDSAKSVIDSLSFLGFFNFINASSGTYYIVVKHFNCIETWSKAGGENLIINGTIYNYDFTTTSSQAYGNNLKLKGSKYCLYSGDVNQDGYITLFDVILIYNDASNFVLGRNLATDLTGDNIIDLTDVTLGYNNSASFISKITP